jgi:outer membrane protein assembly factor BamB
MDGKELWNQDLGVLDSGYFEVPDAQWGFASSPIIYKEKVIVQCDIQKNSFIAEQLWMTLRNEVPTWGTPTIYTNKKKPQVVCNGWKHIAGYDVDTGKELWSLKGGGDIPVPTPIVAHNLIYITNAHGGMAPMYAIKTSAKGKIKLADSDATSPHVAWWSPKNGIYMQTPLVIGDLLFACNDMGIVSCYDAKDGTMHYRERIGAGQGFTASGVAADDKIYYTSEVGDVIVVKAAEKFEKLGKSSLGENCMATPAISEGVIFFHTQHHVIAVGEKD